MNTLRSHSWAAALPLVLSLTAPTAASEPPADDWSEWDYDSEEEAVLTTEELRTHFHDLVAGPLPIRFHGAISAGARSPYYALGFALEADFLPVPWLRLAAMAGMGMQFLDKPEAEMFFATAGEAWVGLRVLGIDSQTTIEVPPRIGGSPRVTSTSAPLLASVPAYHGIYVEGGVANGLYARNECVGSCDAESGSNRELASRLFRLWNYGLGIRYVYQRVARSEHFNGSGLRALDLYVHYFFRPLEPPEFTMYDSQGYPSGSFDWGLRAGASVPLCGNHRCLQFMVAGGVSPVRPLPFVEGGFGYHFWSL